MLAQHLANQLLVVARAVDVGGVEEIEPQLDRVLERRGGFSVVSRAIELRHSHASQAQFRHHESLAPEFSRFHKPNSLMKRSAQYLTGWLYLGPRGQDNI